MAMGFRIGVVAWLAFLGLVACRIEPPNAGDYEPLSDTEGSTSSTGGPSTEGIDSTTTTGSDGGGTTQTGTDAVTVAVVTDGSTTQTDTEPVCGDGIIEGDEECDDGRESTRCDGDCTERACGDGITNEAAGEACDDAGESMTCDVDCTPFVCGDALVNMTAGESCDDGGESPECDVDCTPFVCGDALVNRAAGEDCDDGGESPECDVDCTPAFCGDAIFNASFEEQCDEGGETALCDADCTLVDCGDGFVNVIAGEDCDDGGESATCNVDCSFSVCGDGKTNGTAGEDCDDIGNSISCDADCTVRSCGDGFLNTVAYEDCDDAGESAACDDDCTDADCGDSQLNTTAGEQCDGPALGGAVCQDMGYLAGTLACTPGCSFDVSGCANPPGAPVLVLAFSAIKQFDFSWAAVDGADYYLLEESAAPGEPFVQLGGGIVGESISLTMPLHLRYAANYRLLACNIAGCTDSDPVNVVGSLAEAVGYVKASNTGEGDRFGWDVALSGDGTTLAVGAFVEDSAATGIDGAQANEAGLDSGAVYVFVTDGSGQWWQQAYIKASNANAGDFFGQGVELSDDGNTLAVGAYREDSGATGVGGDQASGMAGNSGAVYIFVRDTMSLWSQQAYVKAYNTATNDRFGQTLALSGDGDTLAVGAYLEDSNATGVDGDQFNDGAPDSGAVYVFVRNPMNLWLQQAYIKASNTGPTDSFSLGSVALSDDGNTLAVGARNEDSNAMGIDGDQANNAFLGSGAAYVFLRDGMGLWTQQAYLKASNPGADDAFGATVALSGDGNTLAVGAEFEDSNATGIDGDQANDAAPGSGAVYVFTRSGMGIWAQQAYVKASMTGLSDLFGSNLALNGDGNILIVGEYGEDSNATGIDGDQINSSAASSGAVYVFLRHGTWTQQAFVKASNTDNGDRFGVHVAVSDDGNTVAVGADLEDGHATGVGGDQASDAINDAGAVYLF